MPGYLPRYPNQQGTGQWADCEIGALIHFDINVYEPEYRWRGQWDYNPDPKIFNPTELNTDQWVKAIKDMGGQYAVLVVKHCTGFCLWPTRAHDSALNALRRKNGQGDILAEFIQSCKNMMYTRGYISECSCYWLSEGGQSGPGKQQGSGRTEGI